MAHGQSVPDERQNRTHMHSTIKKYLSAHPKDGYLHYHAPRFSILLQQLEQRFRPGDRILEIGPSRFSAMAAQTLRCSVDTLGFNADTETPIGRHWCCDLNQLHDFHALRTDLGPYDHVLFAEVIEHLHTAPVIVLEFIRSLMALGGKLYLQTPNAVALHKRLILLMGRNPYQEIQLDKLNPGHFREYTRAELTAYVEKNGLSVEKFFYGNYFDYRYTAHVAAGGEVRPLLKSVNWFYNLCPGSFKPGMTFILGKDSDE